MDKHAKHRLACAVSDYRTGISITEAARRHGFTEAQIRNAAKPKTSRSTPRRK